jgi:poly-gamma-glutamate capsule biosynthesis protein CapA/YwtB (metallophosphatase superfamily)
MASAALAGPETPPPIAAPAAAPEAGRDIVIGAVGDIMLGSTFPEGAMLPPRDGAELLAEVSPVLRAADVAFGNLEGPLVDGHDRPTCTAGAIAERQHGAGGGGTSCWSFRVPTRYGRLLADAGFDVLSLANNHILDFGEQGRTSTLQTLDRLGIAHSGPVGTVAHLSVRGTKIDVIAFATYETSNDLDDLDAARALVARSASAADVVLVSFHGGAEGLAHQHVHGGLETFHGESRGAVRAFARAMVDAGADLVLGHGPHVVRGMEIVRGRLIAYSLGNFATYGGISVNGRLGVSLILEAHLGPDGAFRGGRVHPIRQTSPGGPRLDAKAEVIPILRELSRDDFGEAAVRVDDAGALTAP